MNKNTFLAKATEKLQKKGLHDLEATLTPEDLMSKIPHIVGISNNDVTLRPRDCVLKFGSCDKRVSFEGALNLIEDGEIVQETISEVSFTTETSTQVTKITTTTKEKHLSLPNQKKCLRKSILLVRILNDDDLSSGGGIFPSNLFQGWW